MPGNTRNIMLTGYWPPTNEMLRAFSTSSSQNPGGWQGENWRGYGFNLFAYFPEFPNWPASTPADRAGVGDLRVDYQDTSSDFWRIADGLEPCAIITFSLVPGGSAVWEVEWRQRNLAQWQDDYLGIRQPTTSPPDASVPAGTVRNSTLPVDDIVANINAADIGIYSYVDRNGDGGGFLSEFIAYHGVWYQALHSAPSSSRRCFAAGHIHVGENASLAADREALAITLETVIAHVRDALPLSTVPEVTERGINVAITRVREAGLREHLTGTQGPGAWVWRQNPSPGTRVEQGSTVSLQVRSGPRL